MLRKSAWIGLLFFVFLLPSILLAQETMHGKWWHNKTIINKAMELIDSKRINLPNLEGNYQEPIEVDMIKANKDNPHSFIKNQNELNKYIIIIPLRFYPPEKC